VNHYTKDDFDRDWTNPNHDGNYGYPEFVLANGNCQCMDIEEVIVRGVNERGGYWGDGYKQIFCEIVRWCIENCGGAWVVCWNAEIVYFENKQDEMLFRLRWV
jgi:hypothetical protein